MKAFPHLCDFFISIEETDLLAGSEAKELIDGIQSGDVDRSKFQVAGIWYAATVYNINEGAFYGGPRTYHIYARRIRVATFPNKD